MIESWKQGRLFLPVCAARRCNGLAYACFARRCLPLHEQTSLAQGRLTSASHDLFDRKFQQNNYLELVRIFITNLSEAMVVDI